MILKVQEWRILDKTGRKPELLAATEPDKLDLEEVVEASYLVGDKV